MTKITFNGKEIEFDKIVGYGCSFMAGAECLDHLINTEYSDLQKINKLKRKFKYDGSAIYQYLTSKKYVETGKVDEKYIWEPETLNYPFLFEEQKRNSWLQRLSDRFQVPCVNNAWSGGSLQSMQYFHEENVLDGKINDTDLIIVGLTSLVRWFYLDKTGSPLHPLFGYDSHNWGKNGLYAAFALEFSDNHSFLVYNALTAIKYFSNIKNPVIFVPSFVTMSQLRSWHPLPEGTTISKMFDDTIKNINLLSCSFNDVHSFDYSDEEAVKKFAGMHPTIDHQQQFGDLVYKELTGG